jgi:hypothetical protein
LKRARAPSASVIGARIGPAEWPGVAVSCPAGLEPVSATDAARIGWRWREGLHA